MRDPKRIEQFCNYLRAVWMLFPDWRFGQLVSNIYHLTGNPAFFYKEDDELLQALKDVYEEWRDVN